MVDRDRWAPIIERFINDLSGFDSPGGRLDVRENVRFRGGNCARWAHRTFPDSACILSLEVKKFFMDEWTGQPVPGQVEAVGQALAACDIRPSMSRRGDCYDNAPMESFFGTLKSELVHHRVYHTRDEARPDLFFYIEAFYNPRRRHSALGYSSPVDYESAAATEGRAA